MTKTRTWLFLVLGLAAWASGCQMLLTCGADDRREPQHLTDARELVRRLDLAHTSYEHGAGTVTFSGTRESHTDCSGFIDALLKHSYGYDEAQFKKWFGARRPTAARQ